MLIQLDWLKEYADFDIPAEELAEVLSMGGLEVESLEWVELLDGSKTQVMEVNVTPNRGYCLSYKGVAREVSALLGTSYKFNSPEKQLQSASGSSPVEQKIAVENQEPSLCSRYTALVIENVLPAPSPKWLTDHLLAIGLRPINNIVDITNFVMMEYGQPLHAFDRDLLAGFRIVVRRARDKEPFKSLDGNDLVLEEDALVIADAEKPVALAGIMGGANSEVSNSTRTIVLESASFDSATVRKGAKKYGIRTDSSYRFEREVDIDAVVAAQSRAALLIKELAGGEICKGRIDIHPHPKPLPQISLRVSRVNQILGLNLKAQEIESYLKRLGMNLKGPSTANGLKVEVPRSRPTLTREIDLIEEIARLHGFEKVEVSHPAAEIIPVQTSARRTATRTAKETLKHLGFSEAINYSFVSSDKAEVFKAAWGEHEAKLIYLSNPLSNDWSCMRTSLLPSLLNNAALNMSRGQKPVKIFELGDIYFRGDRDAHAVEKTCLCGLVAGPYEPSVWKDSSGKYDFFDLKGSLETLFEQFKLNVEFHPLNEEKPFMVPGKTVECRAGKKNLGFLGEVSEATVRQWNISSPGVFAFEINFGELVECLPGRPRFQPIAKYPETYRDISLLVDQSVSSLEIHQLILASSAPLISRVELYDHFSGKKIEKGKKSLTYSLAFQSAEKTLTDAEVNPLFEKIVETLAEKVGAKLRE